MSYQHLQSSIAYSLWLLRMTVAYVCTCACAHVESASASLTLSPGCGWEHVYRKPTQSSSFSHHCFLSPFSVPVPSPLTPLMSSLFLWVGAIPVHYGRQLYYIRNNHDQKVPTEEEDISVQLQGEIVCLRHSVLRLFWTATRGMYTFSHSLFGLTLDLHSNCKLAA